MSAAVLDRIEGTKARERSQADVAFRELMEAVADGTEPSRQAIEQVLRTAGKTMADLKAAVELLQRRREMAVTAKTGATAAIRATAKIELRRTAWPELKARQGEQNDKRDELVQERNQLREAVRRCTGFANERREAIEHGSRFTAEYTAEIADANRRAAEHEAALKPVEQSLAELEQEAIALAEQLLEP